MLEPELVIFNEGSKNKFNEMLLIDLVIFFFTPLFFPPGREDLLNHPGEVVGGGPGQGSWRAVISLRLG